MIEQNIIKILLDDPTIKNYTKSSIFAVSAPKGFDCPLIVVTESDNRLDDDVITEFNITIEIYDFDPDYRKIKRIGNRIKNLLHFETIEDIDGVFSNIRIRYVGSNHTRELNNSLSQLFIDFSCRAIENINETY